MGSKFDELNLNLDKLYEFESRQNLLMIRNTNVMGSKMEKADFWMDSGVYKGLEDVKFKETGPDYSNIKYNVKMDNNDVTNNNDVSKKNSAVVDMNNNDVSKKNSAVVDNLENN